MANEITIKIKVDNDSSKGFEEALAEARAFAGKLKEEMDKAGKEAGDKAADEIKRQLEELEPPSIDIDVKADEAKAEIHEVKDDLDKLDRDHVDVEVHIDSAKAIAEAEVLKKELKHELSDAGSSGGGFGKSIMDSLKNFDFKPGLMSVGIAVGVAFAPLIGASIAGAVVGGFGLGGIVGGVVLAAKDPRVQSAFTDMKHELGDSLKVDAAPFVPVVIEGIQHIKQEVDSLGLGKIFADLAPQLLPVLDGVLDLVGSLGHALGNIAANSGPVLKELGTDFRNFGLTLEGALNSLTDNSKQEAQALHDLFAVLDGSITIIFGVVNALTEMYGVWHKIFDLSPAGFFETLQDHSQKLTPVVNAQVAAVIAAVDANNQLAGSSQAAADAQAAEAAATKKAADALKAATDPTFALLDAQNQVTSAQKAYNDAVKKGGENSKGAKDAQANLDKAYVNLVGALSSAKGGTDHLTDAQKQMLKSAGASDSVIKDLNARLKAAYDAAKKLDGFRVDITVAYSYKTFGAPRTSISPYDFHGLATGGIKGAATGATSSDWTWVGEDGPELRKLPPGTSVRSAGDSKRMVGGVDAAGGPMIIQLVVDGHVIAQATADGQRKFVRDNFGGNVQKAYGVGA